MIATVSRFCGGGSGHVANGVNAQGGLMVLLKSSVTAPFFVNSAYRKRAASGDKNALGALHHLAYEIREALSRCSKRQSAQNFVLSNKSSRAISQIVWSGWGRQFWRQAGFSAGAGSSSRVAA